ncbi:MAG: SPOR domain-containing protein [Deltaproteobacteria bacterium]|nr:SPOR domain-containing protein [Deltaproteobacteria bacterium]
MSRTDVDTPAPAQGRLGVRDMDRIQEKVSVSLEPRQLMLLGLGVAVVMAATFVMGMLMGGSDDGTVAKRPRAIAGAPVSGAFPAEPPVAGPRIEPVKAAMVKPTRIIRKAAVFPAPNLKPFATARGLDDGDLTPRPRRGIVTIPDSVFDTDRPWPSVAVTDLALCMSCIYEDRGGCVPTVLPPPVAEPVKPVVPVKPPVAMKTPPPPPPPKKAPVVKAPPMAPKKKAAVPKKKKANRPAVVKNQAPSAYSIQVRAYREKAQAREFSEALTLKGYKPHIVRFVDPKGRGWYRVRLGRFANAGKAQDFAKIFNESEQTEAIPVALE